MDFFELWNKFEESGSIADYLAYRTGIHGKVQEGEQGNADNN